MYKPGTLRPDTIFVGRHPDFPAISLPASIAGTPAIVISPDGADLRLAGHARPVYLNIMGWVGMEQSEFLIVTFHNSKPQHNCSIFLRRPPGGTTQVADSIGVQYPYGKATRSH